MNVRMAHCLDGSQNSTFGTCPAIRTAGLFFSPEVSVVLLAILLICSGVDAPQWLSNACNTSFYEAARSLGVLGGQDFGGSEGENWGTLVGIWRERLRSDTPPLSDIDEWESSGLTRGVVREQLGFGSACGRHFNAQIGLWAYEDWYWRDVVAACKMHYAAYDLLDDAYSRPYPWERRSALAELRDLIGDDMYFARRLPPIVPVWAFKSID